MNLPVGYTFIIETDLLIIYGKLESPEISVEHTPRVVDLGLSKSDLEWECVLSLTESADIYWKKCMGECFVSFLSTIYTEKCVCQGYDFPVKIYTEKCIGECCDFPFKIYILKNVLNTMIFLSKLYIEKMYVGLGVRAANFLFIWHSPYNLSHTLIIHHFYIDYFDWNRCTIQVLGNQEL